MSFSSAAARPARAGVLAAVAGVDHHRAHLRLRLGRMRRARRRRRRPAAAAARSPSGERRPRKLEHQAHRGLLLRRLQRLEARAELTANTFSRPPRNCTPLTMPPVSRVGLQHHVHQVARHRHRHAARLLLHPERHPLARLEHHPHQLARDERAHRDLRDRRSGRPRARAAPRATRRAARAAAASTRARPSTRHQPAPGLERGRATAAASGRRPPTPGSSCGAAPARGEPRWTVTARPFGSVTSRAPSPASTSSIAHDARRRREAPVAISRRCVAVRTVTGASAAASHAAEQGQTGQRDGERARDRATAYRPFNASSLRAPRGGLQGVPQRLAALVAIERLELESARLRVARL